MLPDKSLTNPQVFLTKQDYPIGFTSLVCQLLSSSQGDSPIFSSGPNAGILIPNFRSSGDNVAGDKSPNGQTELDYGRAKLYRYRKNSNKLDPRGASAQRKLTLSDRA